MKQIYNKIFRTILKIVDRILFAFKMYTTKNTNSNWLYEHKIASSAYPNGDRFEYLNGININELGRKKIKV